MGGPSPTPWAPSPLLGNQREDEVGSKEHTYPSFPPLITSFCQHNSLQTVHVMWPSHHVTLPYRSQLTGPRWLNLILDSPKNTDRTESEHPP